MIESPFARRRVLLPLVLCPCLLLSGCLAGGSSRRGGPIAPIFENIKGVPWTILLWELDGPYAADQTEEIATELKNNVKGIDTKSVVVLHNQNGYSRIYYGSYDTRRDARTGKMIFPDQLERDLNSIRAITMADATTPFVFAHRVRMPTPDVGEPEWNLANVRQPYTLQVAAFEADVMSDYKKAAADMCEALRKQGHEAYYFHAPAASMVTVGAFGRDAVRLEGGQAVYSSQIRRLQQNELFKYNLTNGQRVTVHKGRASAPVASQLVMVPGHEPLSHGTFQPGFSP